VQTAIEFVEVHQIQAPRKRSPLPASHCLHCPPLSPAPPPTHKHSIHSHDARKMHSQCTYIMPAQHTQSHDKLLWEDLIEHSLKQAELKNSDFLASLLDHLGSCGLNPIELISQVGDEKSLLCCTVSRIIFDDN
jgi:hypothetical protein